MKVKGIFWLTALVVLSTGLVFSTYTRIQAQSLNEGYIAFEAKQWEKAIDALTGAIKNQKPDKPFKDAQLAKGYTRLGQAYFQMAASPIPQQKGKYPTASILSYESYLKGREYDKDKKMEREIDQGLRQSADLMYNDAARLFNEKDYKGALQFADNAIKANQALGSKYYGAHQLRGYIHISMGDSNNTIADFEKTIELYKAEPVKDKESDIALMYRYLCLLYGEFKKNPEKALAIITEGRKNYPGDADIKNQELDLFFRNKSLFDRALGRFEEEVKADPNNHVTWIQYGNLLEQKDRSKAEGAYKKAVELKPDDFVANFSIGAFYVNNASEIQRKANEIEDYKKAEEMRAGLKPELQKAMNYLEKALQLKPDNLDTLNGLIQVYTYLEMNEKAQEAINKRKALGEK